MSRDEGFAIADVSTSHFEDDKVKALWRAVRPDEAAMNAAMTLHEATMLASWRDGKRMTAEDAAPAWMMDVATPTAHLTAHGLLDADGKVPRKSWNVWFGVAKKRREQTRDRWRRAKRPNESSTEFNGTSAEVPRGGNGGSSGPSVRPSVPTESLSESSSQQPGARATRARGLRTRGNGRPEPAGAILEGSELMTPELRAAMAMAAESKR